MIYFDHLGYLGQLGNQMFQYASVKGISKNVGYDFCVSNHEQVHVDYLGNRLRTELFDVFKLESFDRNNIQMPPSDIQTLSERHFHFDSELFNNCPDNINLFGSFQSEKYFINIRDEILKDYQFHDNIKEISDKLIEGIDRPIALHIRRGDYLINSGNHTNLGIDYYEKALSYFDAEREVIIFSDDPSWCIEQEIFEEDRFIVSDSKDPYVDLCLMTMCSDFIIANSSYSWWGAWLSQNENKKVISPLKWFGPNNQHHDTKDLFPQTWIVID